MLVYGERSRTAAPRALIEALRKRVATIPPLSSRPQPQSGGEPGPPHADRWRSAAVPDRPSAVRDDSSESAVRRHAALVAALIEAGELAQGLADAALDASGADGPEPASEATMALTSALARAVLNSWRSGFAAAPDLTPTLVVLDSLSALPLPVAVTTKVGEGYAFYALYPEAYAEAAAALDPAATTVIGLRSIGTSLAALVAAALDAPRPITLRPVGHPFRRELSLSPELDAALADPHRRYAVVDEGPGLSGSSFGAVLDRLEANGVPREHIVVFPSHGGDLGPKADPAHRARWATLDQRTLGFDDLILNADDPAHRLESWVADLTGPATAPIEDLSGGAWRAYRYGRQADWPPSHTRQERRKYLMRTARGIFLLKFTGIGRTGVRKLAQARALAAAGFCPEPLGLRHGFLVERWIEPAVTGLPSPERLAAYLAFRARAFPAGPEDGASLDTLFEMACVNAREGLGANACASLDGWASALPRLSEMATPVFVDGRMQRWEWVAGADGIAIKTDAVDHSDAHDLIGAQDIAWDVAGATLELDLSVEQADALRLDVERRSGRLVDAELTAFMTLAYGAFQLGAWTMAADAHAGSAEHPRLSAARARYAEGLARATARPPPG